MLDSLLMLWMLTCCEHFGVEPAFAKAVAIVESGGRCGPLGKARKFYGPMGIASCFKKQYPIENPFVNIMLGVRALRGKDKRRVLKRYNTEFSENYYKAVMQVYRRNK